MIEEPFSDLAKNVIFASDFFSGAPGGAAPRETDKRSRGTELSRGVYTLARNRNGWGGPTV